MKKFITNNVKFFIIAGVLSTCLLGTTVNSSDISDVNVVELPA